MKKKPKAGMMEGLLLVGKYSYVQGIAACSCIFMIKVTILDYAMKLLAEGMSEADNPGDPVGATNAFASFMGVFGVCTNGLSFFFSLVGTSFVIRRFGLKTTLMLFPSLCFIAMVLVYMFPNLQMVFVMMLVLKALHTALNNPCKELLYQPTSDVVKFKAKSWIDVFGQRSAKALGSVVTIQFSDSAADLLNYGMGVAIALTVRARGARPDARARGARAAKPVLDRARSCGYCTSRTTWARRSSRISLRGISSAATTTRRRRVRATTRAAAWRTRPRARRRTAEASKRRTERTGRAHPKRRRRAWLVIRTQLTSANVRLTGFTTLNSCSIPTVMSLLTKRRVNARCMARPSVFLTRRTRGNLSCIEFRHRIISLSGICLSARICLSR